MLTVRDVITRVTVKKVPVKIITKDKDESGENVVYAFDAPKNIDQKFLHRSVRMWAHDDRFKDVVTIKLG